MALVTTVEPDGKAIKIRRELAGLTQQDLGKLVLPPVSRQTICDAENARRPVSALLIGRIAKVLKAKPEELIRQDAAA